MGSLWDHTAGMSSSIKLLVNFRLSGLLITILNISYKSARRYSPTTYRLQMKCSTYIGMKHINEIPNRPNVRLALYFKVHERKRSRTCKNCSKCNIAYNQSVVKLLDERVWGAILFQVCEWDLSTLKGARICVEIKPWDCGWGDGGLTATLAPQHLCSHYHTMGSVKWMDRNGKLNLLNSSKGCRVRLGLNCRTVQEQDMKGGVFSGIK